MSATGLLRFDDFTAADGGRATIDGEVGGFLGAHGGYVMTLALRSMRSAVGDAEREPRSLGLHLLAPVAPGPVELDSTVARAGGSLSTTTARVEQAGATVALALGAFGRARPSLRQRDTAMPAVPPPEECAPLVERPVDAGVNMLLEHRPASGPLPLSGGDRAELVVWIRLAGEDRPVDAASATFLADSAAPALYGALTEYVPIPSTEITVHYVDPVSDDPWVLAVVRNRAAGDGYAIEDGELWSTDGRLLLVSRQMRRVLSRP